MKRFILVLFILFSSMISRAQTTYVNIDSIDKHQILPNKIFIGELHQVPGTYKTYETLIRSVDPAKQYKLVIERSVSFSYLINEFLSNSDTTVLEHISFHNDEERAFYTALYSMNRTLESAQKIMTIGIDLEYQLNYAHTLYALKYYLPKTATPPSHQEVTAIFADSGSSNLAKVKSLLSLIDTSTLNINSYDRIVRAIYRNSENTIAISKTSRLTWGRKRERFLLENYTNRVSATSHFIFIVGVAHLPDNTLYPSFTKELAKDAASLQCYYPIYFNHTATKYIKEGYYCEHRKDPLKPDRTLLNYFDTHKGAWILKKDEIYYLVLSN